MMPGIRPIPDPEAEMERLAAMRKEPAPALTPDLIRAMLRGHFAVLEPGETLVIRTDRDWTPNQIREFQDFLDCWHRDEDAARRLPFRVIALPGEEFAVAKAAG